jgi:hypothetical protein
MAILDNELTFSNAQAVTATAVSTNVVDLGVDRDIGVGEPVYFAVQVGTGFAGLTSLNVALQTSDDNSTWTDLATSGAIPVASLTAGAQPVRMVVPSSTKRYLRVNYTVAGTGTAGTVTASLLLGPDGYRAYPAGSPTPDFSAVTNISVEGVSVSPTTASVAVGATVALTASVSPSDASNAAITASSSNTAVATVTRSGNTITVKGVAAGTATITVTTEDGGHTETSTITVTAS